MNSSTLKRGFYQEIELGKRALNFKDCKAAFYHFENAHILGQKHLYRHTVSHYWMFIYAIKTKNIKEVIGQIVRIIASILFTLIWVPLGNTGGSNISPIKPIPVRKELKKYF